jgi:hypothetical protein
MIDHGLTFDWHGHSKRPLRTPDYFKEAYEDQQNGAGEDEDYDHIPAHPEAIKWLKELKPQDFKNFFKTHKVGPEFSGPLINALQGAQRLVKQNKGHLSTMDIINHIRNSYGVESEDSDQQSDTDSPSSSSSSSSSSPDVKDTREKDTFERQKES